MMYKLLAKRMKAGNHVSTGRCYDMMEALWTASMPESPDLTEGLYVDNEQKTYEQAQADKRQFLLDSAEVKRGSQVLDVGCGHGTLLEAVRARGALGIGITLSERQALYCQKKGLAVAKLNWKDLGEDWHGRFDAVIASGSLEHFVSPENYKRQGETYRAFFEKCHLLLNRSPGKRPRLVITTCVFHRRLTSDLDGDYKKHLINLGYFMDGAYPFSRESLLGHCSDLFRLVDSGDATRSYLLTSLEWKKRLVLTWSPQKVGLLLKIIGQNLHHPLDVFMALKFFWDDSWIWQFQGEDPPVRLAQIVLEPK